MSLETCEQIMLDRDVCSLPAEKCPDCTKFFCSICINEHKKVHAPPAPPGPRKIEVGLGVCRVCELVTVYAIGRGCSSCGSETEPIKAMLKPDSRDGEVTFYTEERP